MKKLILLCVVSCVLAGCREEVTDIDLPVEASRLVLISYISPQDTVIEAKLFESRPVLGVQKPGSLNDVIVGAEVILYTASRSIVLSLSTKADGTVAYQASTKKFKIEVGETYFIQATAPDGRSVKAFCTVPAANTTLEAKLDSVDSPPQYGPGKDYRVSFRWQDPAGEINYYRVCAELTSFYTEGGSLRERKIPLGESGELVYADGRLDGTPFFVEEQILSGYMSGMRSPTITAYLLTTDQHYYEYHHTLRLQPDDDENPFTEAVPLYSNIEGGYGVFAAYNRTSIPVKVR